MEKFATGGADTGGKFATGVIDTGGNFATGVVDTGGKFATGVADTGGAPWLANISANFRKKSKWSKWNTLGLGGNWFMKKTRSKKSRDTVPLSPKIRPNWGSTVSILLKEKNVLLSLNKFDMHCVSIKQVTFTLFQI